MNELDKKEIAKIMGEVLEINVLPVLDEMRKELKDEINDVKEELVKTNRKLDNSINRYDDRLGNHEKRIKVLEVNKQRG